MKRLISILLFIAIAFSFCVNGASASALSPEEITEKYGALIDAIEADDYDAVEEELTKLMSEQENTQSGVEASEYEVIDLTTDNFFDYYELVYRLGSGERDSKGNLKNLYGGSCVFALKKEYQERFEWSGEDVKVGFTAKISFRRAKIIWETGDVTFGDKVSSDVRKAIKKDNPYSTSNVDTQESGYDCIMVAGSNFYYRDSTYKRWSLGNPEPRDKMKYYVSVWNVDLVSVSGTIFLNPAA